MKTEQPSNISDIPDGVSIITSTFNSVTEETKANGVKR